MNQKPPSSRNTYAGIRNKVEESKLNYQGVAIEHAIERTKEPPSTPTITKNSGKATELSSLTPQAGGDEGTSHLNANQEEKNKEEKKKDSNRCITPFTREHFLQIFNALSDEEDVEDAKKYMDNKYPVRVDKSCNLKETYDKNCKNRRKWHCFSFIYNDKHHTVVDLDQTGLNSGSSIFVFTSSDPIGSGDINQLLRDYAGNKTLQKIKDEFNAKSIVLTARKHKCPNKKGHAKSWIETLLKSLSS
mgnify:CR=1 FL=1